MIGRTLTHYQILKKIGSGGMGDVYLAEDTKLDRKVALKVLPAELADNADRRSRFQREAKAIAALNHPHIVTVYSVEEHEGVHFITMELLEGKTLAQRLPKKGFALDELYDIALAIADAVAAAHQEAITHRDLKPDNVMVDDDGRIKILDFGLAKSTPEVTSGRSELPTQPATRDGQVMGTLAYMSPEQAEGKAVDARSDIYSMGILFYEMAHVSGWFAEKMVPLSRSPMDGPMSGIPAGPRMVAHFFFSPIAPARWISGNSRCGKTEHRLGLLDR